MKKGKEFIDLFSPKERRGYSLKMKKTPFEKKKHQKRQNESMNLEMGVIEKDEEEGVEEERPSTSHYGYRKIQNHKHSKSNKTTQRPKSSCRRVISHTGSNSVQVNNSISLFKSSKAQSFKHILPRPPSACSSSAAVNKSFSIGKTNSDYPRPYSATKYNNYSTLSTNANTFYSPNFSTQLYGSAHSQTNIHPTPHIQPHQQTPSKHYSMTSQLMNEYFNLYNSPNFNSSPTTSLCRKLRTKCASLFVVKYERGVFFGDVFFSLFMITPF